MRTGDLIEDRYTLDTVLGTGGMAEVWRAQDTRLERPVAIKFLSPSMVDDPENLVRFFSEAQSIARITHPNVVTVLDFGEHDGSPFLVMEHVAGGTLTDRIGSPMLPERACKIIGRVASGAGAAHRRNIVHRDIKPGNILLGESDRPRLADFGIAFSSAGERMTQTGIAIGSPHYLSPEQARGATAIPESDVYSLGVVLYEMLTGVKPFDGENVTAVALAHVEKEPVPPSRHVEDLSEEVEALVLRCLAKDPSARFPNGDALAEALGDGFDVDATVAFPASAAVDVRSQGPGIRRLRRRTLVLMAAGALVASVGFAFAVRDNDPPRDTAEAAEAPASRPERRSIPSPTPSPTPATAPATVAEPDEPEEEEVEEEAKQKKKPAKSGSGSDEASPSPDEDEPEPEPSPSPSPSPTSDAGSDETTTDSP